MCRTPNRLDLDLLATVGRALARTDRPTAARLVRRAMLRRLVRELRRTGGAVCCAVPAGGGTSHVYLSAGLASDGECSACGAELDAMYGVSRPGAEAPTCRLCRRLLAAAEARAAGSTTAGRRAA
jgi:hypothetical protein